MRASELAEYIKSVFPEKSKANAALIARTEVSKSQTALTQARAEALGLNWYIWRTSEDSRVRSSHDFMEGVLVRWSDPPNPELLDPDFKGKKTYGKYHAGNIFNCRCYPEPVVDIDDIEFPCRVYFNGKIQNMTRNRFLEIV
jgi:SPP1 gp7 family putative phage head morphogenesis protein